MLRGGAGSDPVVTAAAELRQWLADHAQAMGALGFLVALVILLLAAVMPRRDRSGRPADEAADTSDHSR